MPGLLSHLYDMRLQHVDTFVFLLSAATLTPRWLSARSAEDFACSSDLVLGKINLLVALNNVAVERRVTDDPVS